MLGVAGLVLFGPKELPKVLGALGKWVGKARKFAMDMRVQSGIDEVLRQEGIAKDLNELRSLARGGAFNLRNEITGGMTGGFVNNLAGGALAADPLSTHSLTDASPYAAHNNAPSAYGSDGHARADRSMEYPSEGADTCGSVASHHGYDGEWPASAHALDALYMKGTRP